MTADIRNFLTERLRSMTGYLPGLQLNEKVLKLNTNENPFQLPHSAIVEIEQSLHRDRLNLYPSPNSAKLRQELGDRFGCGAKSVFIGNGSDEILRLVFQAFTEPGESSITALDPSYSLYSVLAHIAGAELDLIPLKDDWTADLNLMLQSKAKLAVITNPNAPTGIELSRSTLLDFLDKWNRPLLVDEAYTAFGTQSLMKERHPFLMVCGTFSKAYSL
ncbi:MAG: aminotransferase class I/II-fold pyridoxal phosphate-dependent enzyme, partial [Leptonema sp. (in: Bacteria)]|nr:aminotransferase class I/II-fold pyridoxal phosphate-dependent enzyme [Leptonema sp. (in: bacteria)]